MRWWRRSKLQRPAGNRVKTANDALHLVRLLRLGEMSSVRVPSVAEEAARDLVRARDDVRGELMRARHRVSKLLQLQGVVYGDGWAWTLRHRAWLQRQSFDLAGAIAVAAAHQIPIRSITLTDGKYCHV